VAKFEAVEQTSMIDLSSYKTDNSLGIVRGKLKVPGCDALIHPPSHNISLITETGRSKMAQFFRPSLEQIQHGLKLVFEETEGAARVSNSPSARV
jgi:hypothetical protein